MEGFLKEVRFVCMANIKNEENSSRGNEEIVSNHLSIQYS